jgi:hypothetical protein
MLSPSAKNWSLTESASTLGRQIEPRCGPANLTLPISRKLFPNQIRAVELVKKPIDRIHVKTPNTVRYFPPSGDES